jgi:hypothetical protein
VDQLGPFALAHFGGGGKLLVDEQPIDQFVRFAKGVGAVAAPRVVFAAIDEACPQGVGFDIPQNGQQMLVVLNYRDNVLNSAHKLKRQSWNW